MNNTLPYWRTMFSLIFLLGISMACSETQKDFREKYVGQWMFQIDQTNYSSNGGNSNSQESFAKVGEIKYGQKSGELLIQYGEDEAFTVRIDEFGHLLQLPNKMCSGSIQGHNLIQFYLRWGDGRGGLIHEVRGQKITNIAGL